MQGRAGFQGDQRYTTMDELYLDNIDEYVNDQNKIVSNRARCSFCYSYGRFSSGINLVKQPSVWKSEPALQWDVLKPSDPTGCSHFSLVIYYYYFVKYNFI